MFELILGILATLAFPIVAVSVYHRLDGWRNRRAGVRKTRQFKLSTREDDPRRPRG